MSFYWETEKLRREREQQEIEAARAIAAYVRVVLAGRRTGE